MAEDFEKELSRSEKLLKERLVKAGKVAKDITNKAFKELLVTIDDYSSALDNVTEQLASQLKSYDELKLSTRQYGDALKSTLPFIKDNKDLATKLTQVYSANNKLIDKLVDNNEELITGQLSLKDVAKDISKSRQIQLTLETAQRDIAQEIEILTNESIGLQGEELENIGFKIEALRDINVQLEAEYENQQKITENLQEQAKSAAEIETKVGLGGKLLEGFKKIPILGDVLDIDSAEEAMKAAAAGGASGFQTMGAGVKALGPSLKAALGPLALISLAVEAIQSLIEMMFEADKQVTDIAKNFGITKEAARDVRKSFFQLSDDASKYADIAKGNLILQKDQLEATFKMNELLGTQINYAQDLGEEGKRLNTQFASSVKFLKLSEEEQKGILELNHASGKEIDDINKSVLGTTRLEGLKSGILLNERKILKDVLTASNAIKLTTKGGAEGLTQAAIAAAKLGTDMKKVSEISKGLLNFEDSISSELEAELLTGRELNLEKARQYALEGDIEGVAKEITKNIGSAAEFSQMNVIQQEALAKAMGTSREELADMLVQQESLNKLKTTYNTLGAETIKNLETSGKIDEATLKSLKSGKASAGEYFEALQKAGMSTEELTKNLGEQALASLQSQSAQDKFNDALEKAKETFTRFIDGGYLDKLADTLAGVADRGVLQTLTSSEEETSGYERLKKAGYKVEEGSGLFGTGAFKKTKIFDKEGKEIDYAIGSEGLEGLANIYAPEVKKADGGIIKSTVRNITAGEAGPEAIVPLTAFYEKLDMLIDAVKSGGNIYLESDKVGTSQNAHTFKLNR